MTPQNSNKKFDFFQEFFIFRDFLGKYHVLPGKKVDLQLYGMCSTKQSLKRKLVQVPFHLKMGKLQNWNIFSDYIFRKTICMLQPVVLSEI